MKNVSKLKDQVVCVQGMPEWGTCRGVSAPHGGVVVDTCHTFTETHTQNIQQESESKCELAFNGCADDVDCHLRQEDHSEETLDRKEGWGWDTWESGCSEPKAQTF